MNGSYILLIKLGDDKEIQIGKLRTIFFKKGFYVYIGSALNGLEQRINRHCRSEKKIHWHIDYFLQHANVLNAFYKENNIREECKIAKSFEQRLTPIMNFGCSDCKCRSHLFQGSLEEINSSIEKLQMQTLKTSFTL